MGGGTGLNLSQMPNPHAAQSLGRVFSSMGCTTTNVDHSSSSSSNSWEWKGGEGLGNVMSKDERSLLLVKMAKCLLDEGGITMDAVDKFENPPVVVAAVEEKREEEMMENEVEVEPSEKTEDDTQRQEITLLTSMLLEKFQKEQKDETNSSSSTSSSTPSLAKELYDITTMISEGESICLDGLPDETLRYSLERLFLAVGLTKEEMEHDSDDSDNDEDDGENGKGDGSTEKDTSYGFILPQEESSLSPNEHESIVQKLRSVIDTCKYCHQTNLDARSGKRRMGPSMPPPSSSSTTYSTTVATNIEEEEEESEEEDDGPAPLGSAMARKRKGPTISSHTVQADAAKRKAQLDLASGKTSANNPDQDDGGREEWMMKPGEHDFLKGVMSSGTIKNRQFQNKKTHGSRGKMSSRDEIESRPLDPMMKAEVQDILKAHSEARGPSLIDQHRIKVAEEKAAAAASRQKGKSDFSWSRDKDLDAGRKVDKDHLHLVMGGATQELKDKFQGGFSRSFM